jgi:hypothetical protein
MMAIAATEQMMIGSMTQPPSRTNSNTLFRTFPTPCAAVQQAGNDT